MRDPFVMKWNPTVHIDDDGKKYIINPITDEKIYQFIPLLFENTYRGNLEHLPIIDGLFPKINKN